MRSESITISSATEHLAEVRRFVGEAAETAGLAPGDVEAVRLAVDEACSNAIEHAYEGRDDGTVTVLAERVGDGFQVIVQHTGRPFDPETYRPITLAEAVQRRRRGGFGVAIINKLVDEVEYRRRGRISELRLLKQLNSDDG